MAWQWETGRKGEDCSRIGSQKEKLHMLAQQLNRMLVPGGGERNAEALGSLELHKVLEPMREGYLEKQKTTQKFLVPCTSFHRYSKMYISKYLPFTR